MRILKVGFTPVKNSVNFNNSTLQNQNISSDNIKNNSSTDMLSTMDKMAFCKKAQISFGNSADEISQTPEETAKNKAEKILDGAVDKYGAPRFSPDAKSRIMACINECNVELLPELMKLEFKDCRGILFSIDEYPISQVLERTDKSNVDYVSSILNRTKNSDGTFDFNEFYDVLRVLSSINEDNSMIVPYLINTKDKEGKFRFYFLSEIMEILRQTNENNRDAIPILLDAEKKTNLKRSSDGICNDILPYVNKQNIGYFKTIAESDYKERDLSYRELLSEGTITEKNERFLPYVLNATDKDGNKFTSEQVISAMKVLDAIGDKLTFKQE